MMKIINSVVRIIVFFSLFFIFINNIAIAQRSVGDYYCGYYSTTKKQLNIFLEDTSTHFFLKNEILLNHGILVSFAQYYEDSLNTYPVGTYVGYNDDGKIHCIGQYETDLRCSKFPEKEFVDSVYIGEFFTGAIEFGSYKFPRIGKWIVFDSNGNISQESFYKNEYSPVLGCIEKKAGVWKFYDNKGVLIESMNYDIKK